MKPHWKWKSNKMQQQLQDECYADSRGPFKSGTISMLCHKVDVFVTFSNIFPCDIGQYCLIFVRLPINLRSNHTVFGYIALLWCCPHITVYTCCTKKANCNKLTNQALTVLGARLKFLTSKQQFYIDKPK